LDRQVKLSIRHLFRLTNVFADSPWLLVFDNAVEDINLRKYIPGPGRGSVLITTRDSELHKHVSARDIALERLGPEIAAKFFVNELQREDTSSQIVKDIVFELDGLPIAIAQIAGFIRFSGCSPKKFLEMYHNRKHSYKLFNDASLPNEDYSYTIQRCVNMSLQILGPEQELLISLLAFFNTDMIQDSLFREDSLEDDVLVKLCGDSYDWNNAKRALRRHRLVMEIDESSLWMHRIVKQCILHKLDEDIAKRQHVFRQATLMIKAVFPQRPASGTMEEHVKGECAKWLPHVLSLHKITVASDPPLDAIIEFADVLTNCGHYLWELGSEDTSFDLLKDAKIMSENLAEDDIPMPMLAHIYTLLGSMKLYSARDREEGISYQEKALEIRHRHWDTCDKASGEAQTIHLQLANALNNVGSCLIVQKNYKAAQGLLEASLEIKTECGTAVTTPYDFAISEYNIGCSLVGQGNPKAAYNHLYRGWELARKSYSDTNYRVNVFRFAYAQALLQKDRVQEALTIHEEIRDSRLETMGRQNNDTGVSFYALSCVHYDTGDLDLAL